MPRDVQEAARLISSAARGTSMCGSLLKVLGENPKARLEYPKGVLYYAMEAPDLDEPGALTAQINLRLSDKAQFQDRPGACKLIETAVSRGDQAMAARLAECRGG